MIFLILLKFAFFAKKNQRHLKLHCLVTAATAAVNAFWPKEEKNKFSFKCPICGFVNQLDFTQMCNEYTAKILQNKTLLITTNILKEIEKKDYSWKKKTWKRNWKSLKIEQVLIKLKLQEYKWLFLFSNNIYK